MHEDLRRRALESTKTVSRKARSKQSSGVSSNSHSRGASRRDSRSGSRHGTDDEDDDLSDGTAWSSNSIDEIISAGDEEPQAIWAAELEDRMNQILDNKRSSSHGREEALMGYVYILTIHFARDEVLSRISVLMAAFLKSARSETSEKETVAALRAVAITVVTDPQDAFFEQCMPTLKNVISNSESTITKTAAIHVLSIVTFFGGASEEEIEEVMSFFLEIIDTDGAHISADDSAAVVTAALVEWGFLATQLDDMEDATEPAMETLVEQLESGDPGVQVAAGEDIALLYEKSYTELESDEEVSDEEDADSDSDGPKMVKRYTAYRQQHQLIQTLSSLAKTSSKRLSKADRRSLHTNFADILHSVEHPTRGPRYSNAIEQDTGRRYGSRLTVRVNRTAEMKVNAWWKLHRLKGLRRLLQGGFITHYERNAVVLESLPVLIVKK